MTQNLKINDTVIEPSHVMLGTNGSVGVDRLSFTFSDGWDGLLTKATFYPPYGSPVEVLTGHEITVPSEMYRNAGSGKMVISGYAIEDNTLVKRKYTLPCVMEVQNTIVRRGANAIPGTESVYEQLRKQMQSDIAEALEEAKNSGDFDGAAATVEVVNTTTLDSDAQAIVENVGTKSAAKLAFGIPRGAKGDTGATGAKGADGRGIVSIERTSGNGAAGTTDTYTITYSDTTTSTFPVRNGKDGAAGAKGDTGATGAKGADGRGIVSIKRTSGNGVAGTVDTYTITYSDNTTSTFPVRNGKDGAAGAKGDTGERGAAGVYVLEDGETTADIPDDANIALFPTGESITLADGRGISTIERTSGDGSSGSLDTYTITYTDNTTSTFSVRNGIDGQIFNIKGVIANTSALPTASAANSGNAYLVGTATPYLLYACVLDGGAYTWLNLGSISGVKGDKGDKGDTGTGITSLTGNAVNKGQGKRAFVLDIGLSDDTSKTFEYDIVDGTNGTNGTNGTDGEDGRGIVSIERTAGTGAAGTTDTYTITYSDTTTSTFPVRNGKDGAAGAKGDTGATGAKGADGRGIVSIKRTSGNGVAGTVDTYTITYSDTTTSTFPVRNGKDGAAGAKGDTGATGAKGADGRGIVSIERTSGNGAAGTVDTYTITYSDNTTSTFPVRNGADGTAAGITIDGTVTPNGTNAVSGKAVYDHVLSVMGDFNTVASQMETLIGG